MDFQIIKCNMMCPRLEMFKTKEKAHFIQI